MGTLHPLRAVDFRIGSIQGCWQQEGTLATEGTPEREELGGRKVERRGKDRERERI